MGALGGEEGELTFEKYMGCSRSISIIISMKFESDTLRIDPVCGSTRSFNEDLEGRRTLLEQGFTGSVTIDASP